jgi:hypothetical protein
VVLFCDPHETTFGIGDTVGVSREATHLGFQTKYDFDFKKCVARPGDRVVVGIGGEEPEAIADVDCFDGIAFAHRDDIVAKQDSESARFIRASIPHDQQIERVTPAPCNLRPLNNRVLCEQITCDEIVNPNGLVLGGGTEQFDYRMQRVVASANPFFVPGDLVLIFHGRGIPLDYRGRTLTIHSEGSILCKAEWQHE